MPATSTDRISGLTTSVAVKAPCITVTAAPVVLANLQTIGGVTLLTGDRVLVRNQADARENGIWVAQVGAWKRALDFDGSRDVVNGTLIVVNNNAVPFWRLTAAADVRNIRIGVDELTITPSGSTDLQSGSLIPRKADKLISLTSILTPKYNPQNYAGFVGDGITSDQAAIDAMMADIEAEVGTRKFIAIELPNDSPVRGQIKKLCTGGADQWRNVYVDGNNSELIGNTKPATLNGASPLNGDGILHFQGVDGLAIRNLRVNGLCYNTITALTQSGGTATATTAEPHNLVTGEYLPIMDVATNSVNNPLQRMRDDTYNGAKFITVTGADTFTYAVHPDASSAPIITAAKCGFKSTQFGGDNIRLVSCTRVLMSDIDTRHSNDHAIYFVSTTNNANTTDAALSLNDNNVLVSNLYVENCTQTSSTPSGVREMIWSNVQARYFRGGAVKFASHLVNGEILINNLQCFDFSNVGNGTTPNGFILEGGQRVYLDGFNFARAGGVILLPNPTSGRPGQKILKDITISNGTITDCGYCYLQTRRRENHAIVVGDNSLTVGSDAVSNITLRNIDIQRPMGKGYQLGNNNAGTLDKVRVIGGSVRDAALQAVAANAKKMTAPQISGVTISKTAASGGSGAVQPPAWASGTSYTFPDVVYVPAERTYFRKSNTGTHTSTVQPTFLNANSTLADGCVWKNLQPNSAILLGPIEGAAADFADDAVVKDNRIESWADGNGIDLVKCRRAVVEGNTLSATGAFVLNANSTQSSVFQRNTVLQAGLNPMNCGNNLDMTVKENFFDANGSTRVCANFNNDEGVLYTGNVHVNSQNTLSPLGTTLNNLRRFKAHGNTSINCLRGDRLFPQIAARRRNLDGAFFEYKHDGLTNGDAVMLTAGSFIENAGPTVGEASRVYITASGFNTRTAMQANLSATGLSGALFSTTALTSAAFTGAPTAFNWTGRQPVYFVAGNNGSGTPTSGSSAVPADYFGIPDGATINSCGHWQWISWNDFGYPLLTNSETVSYETGKAADGYVHARSSGTAITAMSYDSGTGVVTCTANGHELTNGAFYTIARCWPTAYQVNADANTDGIKDSNPVTVIDSNTFSYTVATGMTQGPVMGIALVKPNGTSQGGCSISSSGSTATLTATNHGLVTGNSISVRMATDDLYNVTSVACTVVDANTLTYTMAGTPASSTAAAKDRLVLFGSYWSEAPNTRTVGAGGSFSKPKTRGIPWGDYFLEFYGPRATAERIGVVPYRATCTFTPGSIAAGATFVSSGFTLSGVNVKMTGRATSLDTNSTGLEARVVVTAANTYVIVLYNPTSSPVNNGAVTFEVEIANTLPWGGTEGVG